MMANRQVKVFAVLGVLAMMSGCFSSKPENITAFTRPYQSVVAEDGYKLMPPDEIEIHCSKIKELDLQKQIIRPDGKVSFEILGEFAVAGKTITEVNQMIREKAMSLYTLTGEQPVDIRTTIYRGQTYFVVGEVLNPGAKICTGRDRLQSAISVADPKVTGWWKHIQVVRPNNEDKTKAKVFEINYNKMIRDGDLTNDVLLEPGDIVYVPPTPLAALGYLIAELMRPIGEALQPVYSVAVIQNMGN